MNLCAEATENPYRTQDATCKACTIHSARWFVTIGQPMRKES